MEIKTCIGKNILESVSQNVVFFLTLLGWRRNILALGVNTMPADGMASKITKASGMALVV